VFKAKNQLYKTDNIARFIIELVRSQIVETFLHEFCET